MKQPSNDISHPVRDAFQEWGHRAKVAATYVALTAPVVMASTQAYAHETGEAHRHGGELLLGLYVGVMGAVVTISSAALLSCLLLYPPAFGPRKEE